MLSSTYKLSGAYNNALWLRQQIVDALRARWSEDRGAALVEYAFLLVLIVVVCIAAVTYLGSMTNTSATDSANRIVAAN